VNETAAAAGKAWDATKDAATSAAEATKRAGESLGKH
jgi:hypothetical protein